MIEVGFEFPSSKRRLVLKRLLELPGELHPESMKIGEDEIGTIIKDRDIFLDKMANRGTGFFLNAARTSYDIDYAGDKPFRCYCSLDGEPMIAKELLVHMASAQPIFGYACEGEERDRWNRIKTKQGINSIESWVGRNPQKYVPGLYWWTLLPTALAERHHVSLAALEDVALEHIALEGGQNLFRFYEKPDEWRSAAAVDTLRASQPGIFDVEKVRPMAIAAKTFLELSAVLRPWH